MRRKKGEAEMMQEAIDKASQLVELLQKENRDVKKRVGHLEKVCEDLKGESIQLQGRNQELARRLDSTEQKLGNTKKQLEESREAFGSMQQSLKKRVHANKELHEKISLLNAKLKEKTKECNEQRTKLLSLENENEYLLKKITQGEEKESGEARKISSDREEQLREALRLKEAFARRCEELKADNNALILAAAEYKQQVLDSSAMTEVKTKIKHVRKRQEVPQPPPPPPPSQIPPPSSTPLLPSKVDMLLPKLIRQKLGIDPAQTLEKQYDQLCSFIEYRLTHIEKLWKGIFSKLQGKDWLRIQNLKDLQSACNRVHMYLKELLNSSGP